jgi:phage-related minor tail protein
MAENERTITTVFKADISQFSASTQDLNRYISQVNSEFKNATASMGRWNDNADGLQAKLNQLNGVLDAETKKLEAMESAYNDLVKQGKQNTKEAQNLATAINNQQAKVKETKKNIDFYSDSLKELKDAGVDSKDALEKLNKQNKELKDNAKELGGNILKGAAVGVAGIAAACVGAIKGLSNLVEETKELRTQLGQLETAFAANDLSAKAAEKTYNELYSVLGDSGKATEASMHLAQIAKDEQELETWTNILTGAYARFGDSLPIENIAEGAQTTLTLNQANAGMVDALEFAGLNVDDFNAQLQGLNTEEEKSAFITDTLNDIYGASAEKYKEVNKDVIAANDAQNKYNQAMADIATKAQPAITTFKLAMVEVLQTILAKFQEVDLEGLIGKISNAITTVVNVALPPLMSAITWILDNLNWLAPLLGSVIGLVAGITGAIKLYNAIVTVAKMVQLAWNLALTANPIGIVIVAIGALVAAFVLLWNKCEGFRNFFIGMWEAIKTAAKSAGEFIGGIFESIMNTVRGVINGIIKGINAAIGAINKISVTIPDWVPEFGGKTIGFNLKTIPLLAKGAVVDKPTLAMVGEAGKEAVMPLENNTSWINELANKIGGKLQSQSVVNNYSINNKFEKMETSRLALHKSNLELKKLIGG